MFIFLSGLSVLTACSPATFSPQAHVCADRGCPRLVVLPVANRSGTVVPLKETHQALIRGLAERGVSVIDSEALLQFMNRHRMRYISGINPAMARALKEETGAQAVLISSIDFYSGDFPPKVSLVIRLVSTGNPGTVLWMDGRGLAGNDTRGILGLRVVEDPRRLMENAIHSLLDSLTAYLAYESQPAGPAAKRFQPKLHYRSPVVSPDAKYRVAIIPFINFGGGKNAADIVSQQFIGAMLQSGKFEVVEPGLVREMMLRYRMIIYQGVSLAQADILFGDLNVDLILGGMVFDYSDNQGEYGTPRVDFSVQYIERKSREVVWSSSSHNMGNDGVFFFDAGQINSAQSMAAQMVKRVVDMMVAK